MNCPSVAPVRGPVEVPLSVHAPGAQRVEVVTADGATPLRLDDQRWVGCLRAPVGTQYWLSVDGGPPLVDPSAMGVTFTADGPRAVVARPWPKRPSLGYHHDLPVIYEMHVKGFGGSYGGVIDRLDHLLALGVDVIELMPVHPFDTSDNYWGYMPVVWGAVHDGYATGDDPAAELADLIAAAHTCGIEVWIDVVVNHTAEGAPPAPTWTLRGLDERGSYIVSGAGSYDNASGTGNTVNPSSPEIRRLIFECLERYADLGVDGFRFDLAAILTANGGELVEQIAEWAKYRDVSLVAEAWDLHRYLVGSPIWPAHWRQWNDRFREDVRSFVQATPGHGPAVAARVNGSHDLFGLGGWFTSVNYVTAHDGMTMYDLFAYDDPFHKAICHPAEDRMSQIKNAFTMLLMSAGPAMFVMGDEFARTQQGNPNPYNIDSPLTWVDWDRAAEWYSLTAFVTRLIELRHRHPIHSVTMAGFGRHPDAADHSLTQAWSTGDLFVMVNVSSTAVEFCLPDPHTWQLAAWSIPPVGLTLAPMSSVVWERRPNGNGNGNGSGPSNAV